MEIIMCAFAGILGIALVVFGSSRLMFITDREGKVKNYTFMFIGTMLLFSGIFYMSYLNEKNNQEIKNNIAIMLETTPDMIIVQDISEKSFLGPAKNNNLRKVYANGKEYIIEVLENNIIKISGDSQN